MKRFSFLGLPCLLLAACSSAGGLNDPSKPPEAVAKIQGNLSLGQANPAGPLRIELAWYTPATVDSRIVSQNVAVTAMLPASFSLDLQGAPPGEAFWTNSSYTSPDLQFSPLHLPQPTGDQSFAVGQVLAYEDLNQNGVLDMVNQDATSAPDRVVAAFTGYVLYTTHGYGAVAYGQADGYGMVTIMGAYEDGGGGFGWAPISTQISVGATNDEWNLMMCTNFNPLRESNDIVSPPGLGTQSLRTAPIWTPDVVLPPADQPLLACSPGGTQFCLDACPAANGQFYVCQTYDTSADPTTLFQPYCTGPFGEHPQCFTMPNTEPAGWPCTYTPNVDCAPDPQYYRCADSTPDGGLDGAVTVPPDGSISPPADGSIDSAATGD
jgi:hypothetical protein